MKEVTITLTDADIAALEKCREKMIQFNANKPDLGWVKRWEESSLEHLLGTFLASELRNWREKN